MVGRRPRGSVERQSVVFTMAFARNRGIWPRASEQAETDAGGSAGAERPNHAAGVVVAVNQVPRAPYGVRGVSDEHQDIDVARRPGVAPRLDPYTTSRSMSPPGAFFQPFEVVEFSSHSRSSGSNSGRPRAPSARVRARRRRAGRSRRVVALSPRGARSKAVGQPVHVRHGDQLVPDRSTHTLMRRSSTDVFRWTCPWTFTHPAGTSSRGTWGEEQVGLARQVGARRSPEIARHRRQRTG